ncbi:cytochrome P450 [Penicillium sp. IBT 35674x]|nr:cytochrome P450 [Penicillium sp. IBT 35674x]
MSEKAAVRYSEDDSGENPEPAPNSNVEPKNRMNYLTHEFFKRFLSGPTLQTLEKELENHLTRHLLSLNVATDSGWTHIHDFMSIFKTQVTSAVVDTICGPNLIRQNPGFPDDLWTVDCGVGKLMSGLPSFLVSKPRSCRARAIQSIKRWRAWAEENSDPAQVGPGGETPYWGTEMFHSLLEIYSNMDGFDDESVATEVLAFIWATTTNSVPSAFWACMDVFRDPELLAQVRSEVESCLLRQRSPTDEIRFDIERLTRQPTLQAVFAETLRLRVHGFLMRFPSKENVIINHDWSIPRDSMILMSSTPGHMNPDIWASGSCESHPVDQFHPGRFLQYSEKTKSLAFSMARAKGHWTPFGGGHHPCPGRHFSRLEILLTIALLVTSYDCEILASEKSMAMSSQNFGFGVLDPCGEIPVRIRRRSMV